MTMDDTRVIHLKLSNGATSDLVALALFSMAYSCKNPSGILPSLFFQNTSVLYLYETDNHHGILH